MLCVTWLSKDRCCLKQKWIFFLALVLGFFLLPLSAHFEQSFPVLYQGRYRPAEAYAQLWLYERYHAQTLKKEDLVAFHTSSSSPLAFLWSLHFLGSASYQTAPLFWIGSAEAKQLAHLPLKRHRFSYQELQQVFYHPKDSEALIQRLLLYHFLKAAASTFPLERREISFILPGLWVGWQGEDVVMIRVPSNSPWPFLKAGKKIASHVRHQQAKILKREQKMLEEWSVLLASFKEFGSLSQGLAPIEKSFQNDFAHLQKTALSPQQIEQRLEQEYPLEQRLRAAGLLFQCLPSRFKEGEWFSLKALTTQVYHPTRQHLQPAGNFTSFSDEHFQAIREAYLACEQAFNFPSSIAKEESLNQLTQALATAYSSLAGKSFRKAHEKELSYPTLAQLRAETFYVDYPWISILIFLYGWAACLWIICCFFKNTLPWIRFLALAWTAIAWLCHTMLLAMRCYILGRPPVSNMFETVLYVPWVATCASLFIPSFRRHPLVLLAACLASMLLLGVIEVAHLNQNLNQVQAVLDSQFWLTTHVLLVVASYGMLLLAALLGHFYLGACLMQRKESPFIKQLTRLLPQALYAGTLLLIVGTILGGVWAAESWGRFWDWDPKESWAFISICFYLVWIHAYRFSCITSFGLAIGAVGGLMVMSFTWYGVNYLLGTGLHSYGFGSGGELYYQLFLGAEALFLAFAIGLHQRNRWRSTTLHKGISSKEAP